MCHYRGYTYHNYAKEMSQVHCYIRSQISLYDWNTMRENRMINLSRSWCDEITNICAR